MMMIEGLNKVLEGSGLPGLSELRELLQELVGGLDGAGCFIGQDALQPRGKRVFRLRFVVKGQTRSVVMLADLASISETRFRHSLPPALSGKAFVPRRPRLRASTKSSSL